MVNILYIFLNHVRTSVEQNLKTLLYQYIFAYILGKCAKFKQEFQRVLLLVCLIVSNGSMRCIVYRL